MKISKLSEKITAGMITAGAFLATAGTVFAATTGGGGVGNVTSIPILGESQSFRELIADIVNVALALIGIVAVVYLIWGGVTYITAGGDAEKAGKGRVAITNAIIGIIIIVAALVIYNAVIHVSSGQLT